MVDRLRQLGTHVQPVNVGQAARRSDTFANLRAEIFWRVRERFERGEVSLPEDLALLSELAALRYGYDGRGRIRLEPKEETKADAPLRPAFGCAPYASDVSQE